MVWIVGKNGKHIGRFKGQNAAGLFYDSLPKTDYVTLDFEERPIRDLKDEDPDYMCPIIVRNGSGRITAVFSEEALRKYPAQVGEVMK